METKEVKEILNKIDAMDHYTYGHSLRVSEFSKMLAIACGFSDKAVMEIEEAALLHDCGKLTIPTTILNKPGKLTSEEFSVIRSHAERGVSFLLDNYNSVSDITLQVVAGHHLAANGTGYGCMIGNTISDAVKIVSIADMFDGIASKRVYRDTVIPVDKVIDILLVEGKCDPAFLKIFIEKVVPQITIDWMKTDTEALPRIA